MKHFSSILATGFAMFAMFFGAGNIVFPLALGQIAQGQNFWGVLGMTITAVIVPLTGLLGMVLYEGNYNKFFENIGKIPGFLLIFLILCLIGPFAGIPRCITIAHSTLETVTHVPWMSLSLFSSLVCLLLYFFAFRPTKIVGVIGKFLTPVLLLSLAIIVIKGLFTMPHISPSEHPRFEVFLTGFTEGYYTMDLLASFFFSSIVIVCLKAQNEAKNRFMYICSFAALLAGALLIMVYTSFSFLAAGYSSTLSSVANHQLLGTLAKELLGPYAGLIVAVLVFFAVFTTMIALTAIFSRFLQEVLCRNRISYSAALCITLSVSFIVSTLHFEGIATFVSPILQICYPALIVLAILNILKSRFNFKYVKPIFYATLATTTLIHILT